MRTYAVAGLVLLASLLQGFAESPGLSRAHVDLAGEWRFVAVPETNMIALPPATATNWQTVTVPGMWKPGVSNGVWLTRSFTLPANLAGRRVLLRTLGAYVGTRVFVNGQACGHYLGGYAPWDADITAACRPGDNTLHLAMTSQGAEAPRYEFYDPAISYDPQGRQTIGILEDIAVEVVPEVFVNDIFAIPAVTNRQLTAVVEIVNAGAVTRTVEVAAAVQELDGKEVKRLPSARVSVAPGATNTVRLATAWRNPRLWWPHDPHLYALRAQIRSVGSDRSDGSDGSDALTARFGFRDVEIQGIHTRLNGKRLMLRGLSWVGRNPDKKAVASSFATYKNDWHCNSLRFHITPGTRAMYEAADELGLLVSIQGPLAAGQGGIADPEFWRAAEELWLRHVKRYRNSPSSVIWAVDNEAGGMTPANSTPGSPFLAQMIRRTRVVDPTRPVTSSHNYTMLGTSSFHDIGLQWGFEFNTTFPMAARQWLTYGYGILPEWRKDPANAPAPIFDDEEAEGYNVGSASVVVGDWAWQYHQGGGDFRHDFGRLAQGYSTYMEMLELRRQPIFAGVLPFGDRWSTHAPMPDVAALYPMLQAKLDIWRQRNPGQEPGSHTFWAPPDVIELDTKALGPTAVAPKEWNGGAWAGRKYTREMILMNDNFFDLDCRLEWSVLDAPWTLVGPQIPDKGITMLKTLDEIGQDRVLVKGAKSFNVPAATHQDFELVFDLPKAAAPADWTLRLEVKDKAGKVLWKDDLPLAAIPTPSWSALKEVVIWPEAGSFAKVKSLPCRHRITAELPSDLETVVIVPRGIWLSDGQWGALRAFLDKGGAALILADRSLPPLLGSTPLRAGEPSVIAHVRAADHPVVRGIPQGALRYWVGAAGEFTHAFTRQPTPAFYVTDPAYKKPATGNRWPLIDAGVSGEDKGLILAPMVEIRSGQGRVLACSLLLAEGLGTDEPGAAWLLAQSVGYLQDRARWQGGALKPARVIGLDLPVPTVETTKSLAEAGTLIVGAASQAGKALLSDKEQLRAALAFADKGGTLLLHNLSAEQAAALEGPLGVKLETAPAQQHSQRFRWRLDWVGDHPLRRGLSLFDVNWSRVSARETLICQQQIVTLTIKGEGPGVINLTQPGALVLIPRGKGRVVIDQVLWDAPPGAGRAGFETDAWWASPFKEFGPEEGPRPWIRPYIQQRAMGYISQLLANLDVRFKPVPARQPVQGEAQAGDATLGLWHFDDLEPSVVRDYGPAGHDLSAGDRPFRYVPGKFGTAIEMDATRRILASGDYLMLNLLQHTVSLWVKPAAMELSKPQVIWMGDNRPSWVLALQPDRTVTFHWVVGDQGDGFVSSKTLPAEEWTRITVVRDFGHEGQANSMTLYFNGEVVARRDGNWTHEGRGRLWLGVANGIRQTEYEQFNNGFDSFVGAVDEFEILNRALGPREE